MARGAVLTTTKVGGDGGRIYLSFPGCHFLCGCNLPEGMEKRMGVMHPGLRARGTGTNAAID